MKKLTVILVIFLCCHCMADAQSSSLKGTVSDTSEHTNLSNAVVSVLRKADSVLIAFTRSQQSGAFTLGQLSPGKYILLITYPKYADFIDEITLKEGEELALRKINIIRKSQLLQEVIVSRKIGAIRIKGDTLEFNADSFKVKEGATVEDLLKKLPGMQVNSKGEITAQGEKVQKVLVDGEEFFSDDPAVVTQNLRADALKSVQVFDKKSDQAAFTGIDDGEKTKTINLQLKDDKKKGYFGKLKLGGGTPGYFENEGMFNAFKGKRKFSAFGTMSNTGKAGLNWQDADRFGGGNGFEYNEEEGYFFSFAENDEFNTWGGRYNGQGLPTAWNGGLHYSNKWNNDKSNLNGNYRYYKQNISLESTTINQDILAGQQYFTNQTKLAFNQNIRHQLNGFYDWQLDSTSSLKLTVSGMDTRARSQSAFMSEKRNEDDSLANRNSREVNSDGEKQNFKSSLLWRKKFAKKGRTISINFDQQYDNNTTNGFLLSNTEFYDEGTFTRKDSVDQRKETRSKGLSLNSKVSYTEPLSKTTFLEFNYGYRVSNSESLRNSFNKTIGPNPKYEVRDSLFSNDYKFNINTQSGGINFRINKKGINFSIGGNISFADFKQRDIRKDTLYAYSYTNFFPRATFRINMGPQRRLSISYNGVTRQPSLDQIQPIRENTDPLNVQEGNPALKQEFRHNINFSFNDYKVISNRGMYVGINGSTVDDAISNASFISINPDSAGKRTNQYINIDGNYNANMYGGYWMKLKKLDVDVNLNMNAGISRYNSFINSVRNTRNNINVGGTINLSKNKDGKYSFYIGPNISYNVSKSSINTDATTRYWTSESEMGATFAIKKKWEIGTEATVFLRQKTEIFNRDLNATKWNAWIAKKFWKNNAGEIRLSAFDILDQNIGVQRSVDGNYISEQKYNTIRRYWLLSFTWNFTHNPAMATPAK